jgi:S-adenosyl-L-methionine hydrolase (adenosine-forming)
VTASGGRGRIVTLTTDFGLRDPYVAEMKAAILSIARDVRLVDVTHEIAPHDVVEAALALEAAARWFPPGTIHVAVVDPGVGTARRGLVVDSGRQRFVGPDNGVFTPFLAAAGWRAFALTAPALRHATVSATFHGRDVFGPAAAHLARGVPPSRFGARVVDPVALRLLDRRVSDRRVAGAVVHVDRFGNLVTSIRAADLDGLRERAGERAAARPIAPGAAVAPASGARGRGRAANGARLRVTVGRRPVRLVTTYGELQRREIGALVGSQGRLEIAAREASAAARLRARRGTPVAVTA